jgi:hypothetical protein
MEENKKKIEQYFRGREYTFEELLDHVDDIEDFEIEVEEQIITEREAVQPPKAEAEEKVEAEE